MRRRVTKDTSPPGHTISTSEPVHAQRGGRDFLVEDERSAERAGKKGGFVRRMSMLREVSVGLWGEGKGEIKEGEQRQYGARRRERDAR